MDKIGILGIATRKLQSINVEKGNIKYTSEGNCLIDIETDSLIYGIDNSIIPNSVKIIGYKAFQNCNFNTIEIPNSVEIIGKNAFDGCKDLILIGLPERVKKIESCAFYGCNNLLNISLAENLKEIGDSAFYECKNMSSIKLPDSVYDIGKYCFYGCKKLSSVKYGNNIKKIKQRTFQNTGIKSLEIPLGVDTICEFAICSCDELESIKIPNSVKVICNGAFCSNPKLTTVNIPASVDSIGEAAFSGCGITELNFSNESDGLIISSRAFEDLQCTELTLPNNVVLASDSFKDCNLLSKLNLIGSIHFKGDNPFSMEGDNNPFYVYIKGFDLNLLDINKYSLSTYQTYSSYSSLLGSNVEDLYVNGVKTTDLYIKDAEYIGENAFSNFKALKSIKLVNCYEIKTNAFNNCFNVKSVVIDGFEKNCRDAFWLCDSIESIYFDNCKSKTWWGESDASAFGSVSSLKKIVVGDNCTSFSTDIFSYGEYPCLNEIHFGVKVTFIYSWAAGLSDCDNVNVYFAAPDIDIDKLYTSITHLCGYRGDHFTSPHYYVYHNNTGNTQWPKHTFYFSSEMWEKLRAESLIDDYDKNISGCINEGIFRPYDATGIEKIEETVDENADNYPVYNLHGVKMQNMDNLPSGIYIKNGKKFMVR